MHDVVVLGASAGGFEPVREILADLPASPPAALFLVMHIPPTGSSALPRILARGTSLVVEEATDGALIARGRLLVAPTDHHLLLGADRVRLDHGPRENRVRPAIDALFRSAARAFGPRVVGIVLSGTRDDGAAGLAAVKAAGGAGIVQRPSDAAYAGMPEAAIASASPDYVLPAREIAAALLRLTGGVAPADTGPFVAGATDDELSARGAAADASSRLLALRVAVRAAIESAALAQRLERLARERGDVYSAQHFEERGREASEHVRAMEAALGAEEETASARPRAPSGDPPTDPPDRRESA